MSGSAQIAAIDLQSKLRIRTGRGALLVEARSINGITKLIARNADERSLPNSHLGFPVVGV